MKTATLLLGSTFSTVWGAGTPWYQGIDSITVLSPPADADASATMQAGVNNIWQDMQKDAHGNDTAFQKGQFGSKRRAILITKGDYGNLTVPVNWYTSLMGVGMGPEDVIVSGISSVDAYPGSAKGSLENFWKSAEGVTTTEKNTLWSVSQAAPLRRSIIQGDLYVSETDERNGNNVFPYGPEGSSGTHYSSGGFMADVSVFGALHWGSQQQFFYRNSDIKEVDYTSSGQSMVFVGVANAPQYDSAKPKPLMSTIKAAPKIAEKPYLVETDGAWFIAVPEKETNKVGASQGAVLELIPMADVFVARDGENAEAIQIGIQGKKALLLTPAIYEIGSPIVISNPNFVILGIGMPTLVTTTGLSAIVVEPAATGVRVAQVLLEAGSPMTVDATEPLLFWRGASGVASDLFARVGVFSYETSFHKSCLVTKADVMVRAEGDDLIFDNAWLWHADHDDCTKGQGSDHRGPVASDSAWSSTGLVVNGANFIGYGLAVEHTKKDLVTVNGENGQVFFFQSELPYYSALDFGKDGYVGFKVGYGVKKFTGYGIGVYQVFNSYKMKASLRFPSTVKFHNVFTWCITGNRSGLGNLGCHTPGLAECTAGACDYNSCQLLEYPAAANDSAQQAVVV